MKTRPVDVLYYGVIIALILFLLKGNGPVVSSDLAETREALSASVASAEERLSRIKEISEEKENLAENLAKARNDLSAALSSAEDERIGKLAMFVDDFNDISSEFAETRENLAETIAVLGEERLNIFTELTERLDKMTAGLEKVRLEILVSEVDSRENSPRAPELINRILDAELLINRLERYLVAASQRLPVSPQKQVVPVYFVPYDVRESPEAPVAISRTLAVIQAWYEEHLDGKTFAWAPVRVVRGRYARNHYVAQDANEGPQMDWGDIIGELYDGVVGEGNGLLAFVEGGGGFAGANGDDAEFAVAMLGDAALASIQGGVYGPWSGVGIQRGAVAHELGHLFGLPDLPEYQRSVMSIYYEFPAIGLLPEEISQLLLDSPFIK